MNKDKTRLAKIAGYKNRAVISAFVPEGKSLTLKDLKQAIKGDFDKDYTKRRRKNE